MLAYALNEQNDKRLAFSPNHSKQDSKPKYLRRVPYDVAIPLDLGLASTLFRENTIQKARNSVAIGGEV